MTIADVFYSLKPLIPRWMQIELRRWRANRLFLRNRSRWPIWKAAAMPPPHWPGWPDNKRFALVLTHDVELDIGVSRCEELADVEEKRGFRSTFGFVPLRYKTPDRLRRTLTDRGFDIIVHDLYHDGKLFRSRHNFTARCGTINRYLEEWQTRGFTSAAMHHDLRWISELNIDYDISTYDVDPFEPQSCGLGRIFPCWIQHPKEHGRGFVEIPYTMPQDFTLFVLMREQTDAIWRTKLDWIAEHRGMALLKTHPDYMAFRDENKRLDWYPVKLYTDFLEYVRNRYSDQVWLATPSQIARYWKALQFSSGAKCDSFPSCEMLCPACQAAHAAGWLHHYRLDRASSDRLIPVSGSASAAIHSERT